MLDQHKSYKELLCYYLDKRKDINLGLALYLIFRNFGYEAKSQFLKLTNYLHKEKSYNEHIKFLTKCRFYRVFPNHLEFITKNVKKNYMFSNNCKIKQNKLIEKLMSQLLNIEIMDLHTRLVHTKKHIKKIKNSLEKTIEKNIISLFSDYYTTKLTFIISLLRIKLEKKLNI